MQKSKPNGVESGLAPPPRGNISPSAQAAARHMPPPRNSPAAAGIDECLYRYEVFVHVRVERGKNSTYLYESKKYLTMISFGSILLAEIFLIFLDSCILAKRKVKQMA